MSEHYSAYMWSVDDWRTDELHTELDNRERGIYRELMDECFVAGSISTDMEVLARFVHEPVEYMTAIWVKISYKFRRVKEGRVTSRRIEKDRNRLKRVRKSRANASKIAAMARWANTKEINKKHATRIPDAMPQHAQTQTQTQKEEKRGGEAPLKIFGEFQRVRLTADQHAKLIAKLNGNLETYIARFDLWVNEAPKAKASGVKREDRHAYESILNWFDRDLKEGKIKSPAKWEPKHGVNYT